MVFCKTCGNLLRPKRNANGEVEVKCPTCSDTSEAISDFLEDEQFYNKLKNLCRSGRAEKQLKTIQEYLEDQKNIIKELTIMRYVQKTFIFEG